VVEGESHTDEIVFTTNPYVGHDLVIATIGDGQYASCVDITITKEDGVGAIPSFVKFDPVSRTLKITPAAADVGLHTYHINYTYKANTYDPPLVPLVKSYFVVIEMEILPWDWDVIPLPPPPPPPSDKFYDTTPYHIPIEDDPEEEGKDGDKGSFSPSDLNDSSGSQQPPDPDDFGDSEGYTQILDETNGPIPRIIEINEDGLVIVSFDK